VCVYDNDSVRVNSLICISISSCFTWSPEVSSISKQIEKETTDGRRRQAGSGGGQEK
jgi:hypothetical protein